MELLKCAVLLLVAACVQVCGALGSPLSGEEDRDIWTVQNWQGYPAERALSVHLAELVKRSKAQQFHGLMGRSSSPGTSHHVPVRTAAVKTGRKRNKGEMFVGLMGRRSSDGDVQDDTENYYYD